MPKEIAYIGPAEDKRRVEFDRRTHVYDPATQQLRVIVKPTQQRLAEAEARLAALETRQARLEALLIEARPDLKTRLRDLEPPVD